jgi:hypothetical protein
MAVEECRLRVAAPPPPTEEATIKAAFAAHGKVVGVMVKKTPKTLRSRCTAVVLFEKADEAALMHRARGPLVIIGLLVIIVGCFGIG